MRRAVGFLTCCGVLFAVAVAALGCTSWQTQSVPPEQVVARKPEQVRLRLGNGSTLLLAHPAISSDSLVGSVPSSDPKKIGQALGVPLADVKSIEVQQISAGKTGLLIAGLGITALAVAAATSSDGEACCSSHPTVSCPLVYSWDGHSWRLDSGTFGGAVAEALARTDVDNLLYPTVENGTLRLRVANELNETDYLDALSILAVDHSPTASVAPGSDGQIYGFSAVSGPLTARDDRGRDALPRLAASDGWSWESSPSGRDTSRISDVRDGVELAFLKPVGPGARLVIDGNNTPWAAHLTEELVAAHGRETRAWYDSLSAFPAMARNLGDMISREAFLTVSVWSRGEWRPQGIVWEAGPELVKRQVLSLDLSGVTSDTVRIRLESAPSFWLLDYIGLAAADSSPIQVQDVKPETATDQSGADVLPLIEALDRSYYVIENGVSAELRFRIPPVPPGRKRSYLVRSSGWYRIHTRELKTPDVALLDGVLTQRFGASRVAVGRMNDALRALEPHP
ncbi:MAG TPA: hypothetical protein VFH40_08085 [Gemmatimonadales bacterium]|nr:hypothetical protein [Gemmatimonadales bacterium]